MTKGQEGLVQGLWLGWARQGRKSSLEYKEVSRLGQGGF